MLEAMAEAVENAAVVLVCLTQRYKESPNCRTGTFALCSVLYFYARRRVMLRAS